MTGRNGSRQASKRKVQILLAATITFDAKSSLLNQMCYDLD